MKLGSVCDRTQALAPTVPGWVERWLTTSCTTVKAGRYHSELWNRDYAHIQIITIEGKQPDLPAFRLPTYQQAPRAKPTAEMERLV